MTNYFIVPGLGNSGPGHWQSHFETSSSAFKRINQEEWEAPVMKTWVETIEKALQPFDPKSVVLIGHSLGCSTIAHWAITYKKIIKGAFLVAPSDLEAPQYTFPATGFTPVPLQKIPFKTMVVASTDDPWVTIDRARFFADCWGSDFINIGNAGHINIASGYGRWEYGLKVLIDHF